LGTVSEHQNPKFGPKLGEIFKEGAKKYNSIQQGGKASTIFLGGKLSFILF
jgi:hypothetical protein